VSFPAGGPQTHVVLGVDGCRAGWVGVVLAPDRPVVGVLGATIGALVEAARASARAADGVDVIGIDMPMHPPESGSRPADLAARAHLGRKASSIFLTPARSVLDARSYADACALARALDGRAISRQAWALRGKIREVGAWLPAAPCPIYEVHPEVSFSVLTGAPIIASKRTAVGLGARRRALEGAGIVEAVGPGVTELKVGDRVAYAGVLGAYAERVEEPDEVPRALQRALKVVKEERRQALLNVICKSPLA